MRALETREALEAQLAEIQAKIKALPPSEEEQAEKRVQAAESTSRAWREEWRDLYRRLLKREEEIRATEAVLGAARAEVILCRRRNEQLEAKASERDKRDWVHTATWLAAVGA